jgi:hypothetical protein
MRNAFWNTDNTEKRDNHRYDNVSINFKGIYTYPVNRLQIVSTDDCETR